MKLTAAVIGLGKIGLGYDYHLKDDQSILTHASAFNHHDGFELIGGVDPDPEKCTLFTQKYNLPAFTSIKSLMNHQKPEVLTIAVPAKQHFSTFEEIIDFAPKAIICEKPFSGSVKLAKMMIEQAAHHRCALLVNYMRRFEPGLLKLKNMIENDRVGNVYKIMTYYSKGLLNNGSHFIDLLQFLFGTISDIKIINSGRKWQDEDPEPDVHCRIGQIDVYLMAVKEEFFSMHEMTIIGSKGIVRYQQGGELITIQLTEQAPLFSGSTILNNQIDVIENEMYRYQWHVCEHLYRHLLAGTQLNSDGNSGYAALSIVEDIINRIHYS